MSFSKIEICNMALGLAGSTQEIQSLEFGDGDAVPNEAALCRRFWALALHATIRSHDWKTLSARANIAAQVTDAPAFGYSYRYSLPADFLRLRFLYDSTAAYTREGRYLLTDESNPQIAYLRSTEDTDLFDPLFVETLVHRLASYLAMALGGEGGEQRSLNLGKWCVTVAEPQARAVDAAEQSAVLLSSSDWLESRL